MRINNPQLFNGQYLASREQIFEKLGLGIQEGQTAQIFEISGTIDQQYLDVESIFNTNPFKDKFAAIDNSISVVSGAAISVVQGTGITISGEGTEKTIAVNANAFALSGIGGDATYASKYALMFNGQQVGKTTIDIPKDQFLEDAEFIPTATSEDANNNGVIEGDPYLKFTFAVNVRDENGAETEEEKVVYVPVSGLVDTYTAGDGIAIVDNKVSIKKDSDSEVFFYVDSTDGVGVSGIQAAIDKAKSEAITDAVSGAKEYTNTVSGDLTSTFETKLETLISGDIATLSSNLGTLSTTVGENTQSITDNKNYIDYVSGQVSGLPDAIATAKAEAISGANAYTDTVSGILDTAAQGYANTALTGAQTYAASLDFAKIALTGELPKDGEIAGLTKDTLWVTAEGDAKIGIVNGDNSGTVIDISKEVAEGITGSGDANVVASTKAVVDYVQANVGTTVSELYKIVEISGQTLPVTVSGRVIAVYSDAGDKEQCYPTVKTVAGGFQVSADGLLDPAEKFTISYYAK